MKTCIYKVLLITCLVVAFSAQANDLSWLSSLTYYVNQTNKMNAPPFLQDDFFQTNEDESASFNVLANDSDANGDVLEVIAVSTEFGQIEIIESNLLHYTPPANFFGQAQIKYTVTDRSGGVAKANAIINVVAVNDAAPVVKNETVVLIAGANLHNFNVLSNDTDIDLDTLIITSAQAMNGQATVNTDNTINYSANNGFIGNDELSYTVSDGNGGVSTGKILISIYPLNTKAPDVIAQTSITMEEDSSLTVSLDHFIVNDVDSPRSSLVLQVASGDNYTVTDNIIKPSKDYFGELTVPISVSDGQLTSTTFIAKVKVTDRNDAPKVFSTVLSIKKNTSTPPLHFYSGFQYDVDIGGNTDDPRLEQFRYLFSLTATTNDSNGRTQNGQLTQVSGQKHGTFIYTPDAGFVGRDYVFYFVYDDTGARSGRGDLVIDVDFVDNSPKIIAHKNITVDEEATFTLTLDDFTITDSGNKQLTLEVVAGNQYTFNGNTITLKENIDGTATVLVRVFDGTNWSAVYEANILVNGINDAPIVFDWQQSFYQGETPTAIHFRTGMQYDPEAAKNPTLLDSFTYQFVDASNSTQGKTPHGQITQVVGQPNGVFVYTPDTGFTGTEVIKFWVTDEQGAQSSVATMVYNVMGTEPKIVAQTIMLSTSKQTAITLLISNFTIVAPNSATLILSVLGGENYDVKDNKVTPHANFSGTLNVPVKVFDGSNFSAVYIAKVNVAIIQKILFIHTDILGTPVAETNANGAIN